jgi:uncharacterized protein (DUF3084 family)
MQIYLHRADKASDLRDHADRAERLETELKRLEQRAEEMNTALSDAKSPATHE